MRHGVPQAQGQKLAPDLSGLATLSGADLKVLWRDLYGSEPPRRIDRSLLIAAIAYRMQEHAFGGLSSPPRHWRSLVRYIFRHYQELGCVRLLKEDLDRRGVVSKRRILKNGIESGGHSFSRGALYALLSNPIYVGEIRHKKVSHPGQHEAILDRALWEQTQQKLQAHRVRTSTGGGTQRTLCRSADPSGLPGARYRRVHYSR